MKTKLKLENNDALNNGSNALFWQKNFYPADRKITCAEWGKIRDGHLGRLMPEYQRYHLPVNQDYVYTYGCFKNIY